MNAIFRKCIFGIILFLPIWATLAHENNKLSGHDTVYKENVQTFPGQESIRVKKEFSTLHPMIVHFPIVFILLACVLQILRLKLKRESWDELILYILLAGIITAYLSGEVFHPHTEGLSSDASIILERHEFFASLTLLTSLLALLTKIVSVYFNPLRKFVIEIITTVLLLGAATFVSVSGHWGAYLTHIEGVGPQGKYLKSEN